MVQPSDAVPATSVPDTDMVIFPTGVVLVFHVIAFAAEFVSQAAPSEHVVPFNSTVSVAQAGVAMTPAATASAKTFNPVNFFILSLFPPKFHLFRIAFARTNMHLKSQPPQPLQSAENKAQTSMEQNYPKSKNLPRFGTMREILVRSHLGDPTSFTAGSASGAWGSTLRAIFSVV